MSLTKATYSMIDGAVVNVFDYGAVGDGVTDDTAAIQAALTYAGSLSVSDPTFVGYGYVVKGGTTVFLPAGAYKTTATLTVPQNVSFQGAGKYSTVIQSTVDGHVLENNGTPTVTGTYDCAGMAFRNFSIIGDRTKTNQIGLALLRLTSSPIENVSVSKCGSHGVAMYQCGVNQISNLECIYNVGAGLWMGAGLTTWAGTPNSLPSNANVFTFYRGLQNDGAGIKFDLGTNGNTFFGANCEYNYWTAGDNVGYNVECATDGAQANCFYGLWTEGPVEAHVYVDNVSAGISLKIDQWRHFGNGAAGNVDRALIIETGVVLLNDPLGQADLYKTLGGSNSPYRINNLSTAILYLTNHRGSNVTGINVVDTSTGAHTGLNNNLFQYDAGSIYNTLTQYQAAGSPYMHKWLRDTDAEPFVAVSPFQKGFLFGEGSAAPTVLLRAGAGTPEGVVTAPVGSLFLRTDGGASTTLYVKQTGTGNTGWVGK